MFRLALCQIGGSPDKEANIAKADRYIREAAANGAQVIALPAQVEDGIFKAYGNSCIADPWSNFIAHADEKECVLYGDIDLDYVDKIRGQLPLLKHRRPEIYREENE